MKDLRESAFSGVAWSAIDQFGQQGFRFIVSLVLARLLAPDQFGLLAMITVFIAIATVVTDAGFSQAVVQRKNITQLDLSTVFFFNIVLGAFMALLLCALAPFVAAFYGNGELTALLRFLSVGVFLTSLGQVHGAQLTRKLLFKRSVIASLPATVISGVVGVSLAFYGWGVWALAMQMLVGSGLRALLLWVASGWRPSFSFSFKSLNSLLPFGSRMALLAIINSIFTNIYILFIGKFFLATDVGYYQRAESFKRMAADNLNVIVARVLFPLFASIQDETVRLRKLFLRSFGLLCIIFFPLMGILAGVAEPLVVTLIGDKWLPCVVYLQLLCVVGALFPLNSINFSVLKSLGHANKLLKIALVKRGLTIVMLVVTYRFGITVMILGQIITSFVSLWINAYYTRIYLELSYSNQFAKALTPTLLGLVVFLATSLSCLSLIGYAEPLRLICGLFVAFCITGVGYYILRAQMKYELEYFASRISVLRPLVMWLYPVPVDASRS
jgi:teichuronic acid exporter